jgi:thiosulfate reductase cytochrome b subunit
MTRQSSALADRRDQAKLGMSVAMGTLVATGLLSRLSGWTDTSRTVHLCAGVALVGFSYWHWSLYQKTFNPVGRGR